MSEQFRFNNGAAYERYMGQWSQLAGSVFLDWLRASSGLRWLDIGCGNGAFTEMIVERCAPASVQGVDPSEAQLAYARTRPALHDVRFHQGDAMALPFPERTFDAAVMPLVIFFVPRPAQGVAEMKRVVGPGGLVAAYGWDLTGGGFPYEALAIQMKELGLARAEPPSPEAARLDVLHKLWLDAGLSSVETREITVQRTFADIDDYWTTILGSPSASGALAALTPEVLENLKVLMARRLPADASGRITCTARANAVKGYV